MFTQLAWVATHGPTLFSHDPRTATRLVVLTHSGAAQPPGGSFTLLCMSVFILFYIILRIRRPGAGVFVFSFRFGGWTFGEPWSVRIVGFSCAPGGRIGERFFYYAITEELHASVIYLEK